MNKEEKYKRTLEDIANLARKKPAFVKDMEKDEFSTMDWCGGNMDDAFALGQVYGSYCAGLLALEALKED